MGDGRGPGLRAWAACLLGVPYARGLASPLPNRPAHLSKKRGLQAPPP